MIFLPSIFEKLCTVFAFFAISIIYYMGGVLLISLLIVISHLCESPDMIKRRLEQKEYEKKEFEKREEMCKNAIPASSTLKPGFNFVASNQQH